MNLLQQKKRNLRLNYNLEASKKLVRGLKDCFSLDCGMYEILNSGHSITRFNQADLATDLSFATERVRTWHYMSDQKSDGISFEDFKRIDARVGTVTQVDRVPRTERLYKILVDLGSLGVRQTISSLVGHYEPNELVGKRVIFLFNLKPSKFAGEVSQGMLLAAEHEQSLALLTTDREIPNGSRIT